jgi:DNA invertase Pin-like site-specific DNA recombinase
MTVHHRPEAAEPGALRVLGYVRVSTTEQATSGAGLAAQRATIVGECERRGWELVDVVVDDGVSAANLDRPGFRRLLERLAEGEADGLVVAKLDRATRSVIDLSNLLGWCNRAAVDFTALDLGVDTTTPTGRLVANVMVSVAEWEREIIGQRTREALGAIRADGRAICGPSVVDQTVLSARIRAMRDEGATFQAIADALNAEGVPTLRGGALWRVSAVQAATGYRRPTAVHRVPDLPSLDRRRRARRPA